MITSGSILRRLWLPGACLLATLLLAGLRFGILAGDAITFPYELDYGEGIVWQQMRMILAGQGYAPLAPYPAIVFHYPPLFHLLAGAMAATGLDQLAAGRLVAVLSTLLAAGFAGLIVAGFAPSRKQRGAFRLGGATAALALLATQPVLIWAVVFRVDMPFLAFSLAGLWLGIRALTRPRAVHGAALCFVAAIFTKQTAIAAPLAVFAVLALTRPRTALAGIGTGMVVAVATLGAVMAATHGEFLRHIALYNLNRFSWLAGLDIPITIGMHFGLALAAAIGLVPRVRGLAAKGWLARLRTEPRDAALAILAAYLAIATAMLGLMFKSGSTINYFLEWTALIAIGAGLAVADFIGSAQAGSRHAWLAAAPWLVAAQTLAGVVLIETDYPEHAAQRGDFERLAAAMRAAPGPILSDDMVLLLRAGKPVVLEPAIFAELSAKHVLDDRPVLAMLERRGFAMLLTEGGPGEAIFDSRYTPTMRRAMRAAYPREVRLANDYVVHLPAGPLPEWANALRPAKAS
ncbi:MAG: hypothetical protein KGN34_11860 [Sphingomonadales bacterium]|nr:hypothetical protein [Sphingomonadales bacterium]